LTAGDGVPSIPPPPDRQPRSRGFSRFGFSRLRLRRVRRGFGGNDALEPVVGLAPVVVLALVADVLLDPLQVLGPEADDAVAVLPLQDLPAVGATETTTWTCVSMPPTSWTNTPGVLISRPRR
jgi:hypothetical protein